MKTKKFDVTDYLQTQEDIEGYLVEVMESGGSPKFIAHAIAQAENARAKLANNNSLIESPQTLENLLYRLLSLGYTIQPPVPA